MKRKFVLDVIKNKKLTAKANSLGSVYWKLHKGKQQIIKVSR